MDEFEGFRAASLQSQPVAVVANGADHAGAVPRAKPLPLGLFVEADEEEAEWGDFSGAKQQNGGLGEGGSPTDRSPADAADGAFRKGEPVWYLCRDGSWAATKVVSVDQTLQPPSYGVEVPQGNLRETEGHRLRPRRPGQPAPPSALPSAGSLPSAAAPGPWLAAAAAPAPGSRAPHAAAVLPAAPAVQAAQAGLRAAVGVHSAPPPPPPVLALAPAAATAAAAAAPPVEDEFGEFESAPAPPAALPVPAAAAPPLPPPAAAPEAAPAPASPEVLKFRSFLHYAVPRALEQLESGSSQQQAAAAAPPQPPSSQLPSPVQRPAATGAAADVAAAVPPAAAPAPTVLVMVEAVPVRAAAAAGAAQPAPASPVVPRGSRSAPLPLSLFGEEEEKEGAQPELIWTPLGAAAAAPAPGQPPEQLQQQQASASLQPVGAPAAAGDAWGDEDFADFVEAECPPLSSPGAAAEVSPASSSFSAVPPAAAATEPAGGQGSPAGGGMPAGSTPTTPASVGVEDTAAELHGQQQQQKMAQEQLEPVQQEADTAGHASNPFGVDPASAASEAAAAAGAAASHEEEECGVFEQPLPSPATASQPSPLSAPASPGARPPQQPVLALLRPSAASVGGSGGSEGSGGSSAGSLTPRRVGPAAAHAGGRGAATVPPPGADGSARAITEYADSWQLLLEGAAGLLQQGADLWAEACAAGCHEQLLRHPAAASHLAALARVYFAACLLRLAAEQLGLLGLVADLQAASARCEAAWASLPPAAVGFSDGPRSGVGAELAPGGAGAGGEPGSDGADDGTELRQERGESSDGGRSADGDDAESAAQQQPQQQPPAFRDAVLRASAAHAAAAASGGGSDAAPVHLDGEALLQLLAAAPTRLQAMNPDAFPRMLAWSEGLCGLSLLPLGAFDALAVEECPGGRPALRPLVRLARWVGPVRLELE